MLTCVRRRLPRSSSAGTPLPLRSKPQPNYIHHGRKSGIQQLRRPQAQKASVDGPSTDPRVILDRLGKLTLPYWTTSEVAGQARWRLAGVVGLTLATTGVSVVFNFLGRDFFNALSEKDVDLFQLQLVKYLGAFVVGIPVFVFKDYYRNKLALEWRQWMTESLLQQYMQERTYYQLQSAATVDNPDQRISADIRGFTDTALALSLTLLNAVIDLVSFSGILYSIYPPLFAALIIYSLGGTAVSIALGKNLVTLNFNQEAREADFRYGLVRVRENAESIAFYKGDNDESQLLRQRLQAAVENYLGLLISSRNLDFFTSFYRFLIQLLPAAVVAPLFFSGKIEFGVINQSQSAFNHILNDMSLVVYQFESLAGFSAVVDRLGQFTEVMDVQHAAAAASTTAGSAEAAAVEAAALAGTASAVAAGAASSNSKPKAEDALDVSTPCKAVVTGPLETSDDAGEGIRLEWLYQAAAGNGNKAVQLQHHDALLELQNVTVVTPRGNNTLVEGLDLQVRAGQSLLVMGPSGAGKTSVLRAAAGLWSTGSGRIMYNVAQEEVMFMPQKPYMVLGSLRDQVLYPRCRPSLTGDQGSEAQRNSNGSAYENGSSSLPATASATASTASAPTAAAASSLPRDEEVAAVLQKVQLGHLLVRYSGGGTATAALDTVTDWASSLSLGEQQRLAWARLLLAKPQLALLDEASSALDQDTEAKLYQLLAASGITYVSIGHRATLKQFHQQLLQLSAGQQGAAAGWSVAPVTTQAAIAAV